MTSTFFSLAVCEDRLARHHDAEVDDLVAVAREHHADDVLADVVDVALHRGEQHLAASGADASFLFSASMKGSR